MTTTPTSGTTGRADDATKGRRERLYWALVLVWSGLVVAADGLDALPQAGTADAWNWIFLGAGVLAAAGCVRNLVRRPDRPAELSSWAFAGVLLAIGLDGFLSGWAVTSTLLLVLGVLIIVAEARHGHHATSTPA